MTRIIENQVLTAPIIINPGDDMIIRNCIITGEAHEWAGSNSRDETGGATIQELLGPDTPHLTDRIDAIDKRIKGTQGTG